MPWIAPNKNAFEFKSDYDRISITREIPNFEWTDSFSIALWAQTNQKKNNKRQFLLGTTGGKNNWWRGWDFYLDDKNYLNLNPFVFSLFDRLVHYELVLNVT